MVSRNELTKKIEQSILGADTLQKARVMDEMANGMQIAGAEDVEKVATGVSLNDAFLKFAVDWGAQYCIFHHGFDVRTYKSTYSPAAQSRLRRIFNNNISIVGYHAALDIHSTIGNNAVIARELGAKTTDTLFEEWGFVATFKTPVSVASLEQSCAALFGHDILAFVTTGKHVKTIGIVSGAGKPRAAQIAEMHAKGVELFITGEPSESVPYALMESGISYFACGHYATEVFGVKTLGEEIQKTFGDKLEVKFLDVPNSI